MIWILNCCKKSGVSNLHYLFYRVKLITKAISGVYKYWDLGPVSLRAISSIVCTSGWLPLAAAGTACSCLCWQRKPTTTKQLLQRQIFHLFLTIYNTTIKVNVL